MASGDPFRIPFSHLSLLCFLPRLHSVSALLAHRGRLQPKIARHLIKWASGLGQNAALCCCIIILACSQHREFPERVPFSVSFLNTSSKDLLPQLVMGKMKWGSPNQTLREEAGPVSEEAQLRRQTHLLRNWGRHLPTQQGRKSGALPWWPPGAFLQSCLLGLGLCRNSAVQPRL